MTLFRELRRGLDRRRSHEADIRYGVYVRPEGRDGLHVVRRECNPEEFVVGSSLSGQTFRPGSLPPLGSNSGHPGQFIIGAPPPGRRGASGFAVDFPTPGDLGAVGITAASPQTVEAGASAEPVTLSGFGFRSGDSFEAVRLDPSTGEWSTDPLVTVATVAVPDTETASVTLTVGVSAPVGRRLSFRVRAAVGEDLMLVTASTAVTCPIHLSPRTYVGAFFPSSTMYAYGYSEGSVTGTLASIAHSYVSSRSFSTFAKYGATEYLVGVGRSGTYKVFSWNLTANTLHEIDTGLSTGGELIGPVVNGATIYYAVTGSSGTAVTLYSAGLGSITPSLVGSLSDAGINWQWTPRAMVAMGSNTVLIQGYEAARAAGDKRLWSNVAAGNKRVATFDEALPWDVQGLKTASLNGVGWIGFGTDRLASLNSGGAELPLGDSSTWPSLGATQFNTYGGFSVSLDGTEIAFYDLDSIFRIALDDYSSLSGCSSAGTGTIDPMPVHGFAPPFIFARD